MAGGYQHQPQGVEAMVARFRAIEAAIENLRKAITGIGLNVDANGQLIFTGVTLDADGITVPGNLHVTGTATLDGDLTAGSGSVMSGNFAPGTSGWSLNSDGSAELNDLTARGEIDAARLNLDPIPVGSLLNGNIAWNEPSFDHFAAIFVEGSPNDSLFIQGNWDNPITANPFLHITAGDAARPNPIIALSVGGGAFAHTAIAEGTGGGGVGVFREFVQPRHTYKFGSGVTGAYYHEEWNLAAQSPPANTMTTLVGMTLAQQLCDYPTALVPATGLWTAPNDGVYTVTLAVGTTSWTAGDAYRVRATDNTSAQIYLDFTTAPASNLGLPPQTVSFTKFLAAGTVLKFAALFLQARTVSTTGANISYLAIHRHV